MKLVKLIDERFKLALRKLMSEPLPLKTAYKLKGIAKRADEDISKYEDVRKGALQKYGKKKEDGTLELTEIGGVILDDKGRQAFIDELNELLYMEIDISMISLNELGDNIKLSADELTLLEDIIKLD